MPSQTRWEAMRASSDMMTRQYWARSGASTPHSFSNGQHAAEVVHRRGDVVGAVGPGDHLGVAVMLAQLLGAPVQVADDRVAIDDQLAVELQHDAQHAVGAGVLRTHVEGHQPLAGLQRDVFLDGQRAHATSRPG